MVFRDATVPWEGPMARGGRLIAVEGSSAAGKTTLVREASEGLGWEPLAEAFDRLDPAPSLEFRSPRELLRLEGTLLAEEALRFEQGKRFSAQGKTVIADTAFFGPLTYTWGLVGLGLAPQSVAQGVMRAARALVQKRSLGLPDLTIYLETSARERSRRARAARARHPSTLFSRHESVGQLERRYYTELLPAVLPRRVRNLRGQTSPESLARRLHEVVDGMRWRPATPRETLVSLRILPLLAEDARRSKVRPNR